MSSVVILPGIVFQFSFFVDVKKIMIFSVTFSNSPLYTTPILALV